MPQMAPLNWMSLMIMFITIMLMFNMINYYMFSYSLTSKEKKDSMTKKINWKW